MSKKIDIELVKEITNFYHSLEINQGHGDIQYRVVLKVFKNNDGDGSVDTLMKSALIINNRKHI